MEAKDKNEYILAWKNYLDKFSLLGLVEDRELSEKVFRLIDKFEDLIDAIANVKYK
jgi:hypothetical protein